MAVVSWVHGMLMLGKSMPPDISRSHAHGSVGMAPGEAELLILYSIWGRGGVDNVKTVFKTWGKAPPYPLKHFFTSMG